MLLEEMKWTNGACERFRQVEEEVTQYGNEERKHVSRYPV